MILESLDCKENETISSNLQSSISYVDDGNFLLVNFAKNFKSIINLDKDKETKNTNKRLYYS